MPNPLTMNLKIPMPKNLIMIASMSLPISDKSSEDTSFYSND